MDISDLRGGLELAPISGVRFSPSVVGDLEAVTCPPYDLIDDDDLAALRAGDSHNIVQLTLPAGDPASAGLLLRTWLASGALIVDASPALYVYEEHGPARPLEPVTLQRGLIGAIGLRAESERVILPHEDVYPGPVRDRLALMDATNANLEPIFLTYEGDGPASDLVDAVADTTPPLLEMLSSDGTTHRLWRLENTPALSADLHPRQALIADGHHRYAAYRAFQAEHGGAPGPWDHGLALLVDALRYPPHLGAIHRVLPHLNPFKAIAQAHTAFKITPLAPLSLTHAAGDPALTAALEALRSRPGAFLVAGADRLWLLTDPDPTRLAAAMPTTRSRLWRTLNTAVLDHLLIADLWGIHADEHSVQVVHDDPAHAITKAARTGGTAIILNPLTIPKVMSLAAGGERVPRKSTSFGPKPRTGLVMRLLTP